MRAGAPTTLGLLGLAFAGALGVAWHGTLGCTGRTGMFCQQQGECGPGLACVKPAGAADGGGGDMGSFGVCQPALRGRGEICLYSSECEVALYCSNQLGDFAGDGRHGLCQPIERPPPDAAARDLSADAATPPDLLPGDAGDGG